MVCNNRVKEGENLRYYQITENGILKMICAGSLVPKNVEGVNREVAEITASMYDLLLEELWRWEKQANEYAEKVSEGILEITDIPGDYREAVSEIISRPKPNNPYGLDSALYNQIEQGVVGKIVEEAKK